jgi:hypothetical protein
MCTLDRPDSVLEEDTLHVGHNCVACVGAVLFNEIRTDSPAFMTANLVARRYNIAVKSELKVERAVEIFTGLTGRTTTPGKANPWDINAPAGHYAVFCMGPRHVIYGRRGPDGCVFLYDPQLEQERTHADLIAQGYSPFQCYHFEE